MRLTKGQKEANKRGSQAYDYDYRCALEFHETMLSMRRWLIKELEKNKQMEVSNHMKTAATVLHQKPDPVRRVMHEDFELISHNMSADASNLSFEELAIFRLASPTYNRKTKKMEIHFTLPSEYHYKPYMSEWTRQALDKITLIWQSALSEIKDSYQRRVKRIQEHIDRLENEEKDARAEYHKRMTESNKRIKHLSLKTKETLK